MRCATVAAIALAMSGAVASGQSQMNATAPLGNGTRMIAVRADSGTASAGATGALLLPSATYYPGKTLAARTLALDTPNPPRTPPKPVLHGNSGALMIVGGAAVVVGALIGGESGTLMSVGGAVVGLVGLYEYVRY